MDRRMLVLMHVYMCLLGKPFHFKIVAMLVIRLDAVFYQGLQRFWRILFIPGHSFLCTKCHISPMYEFCVDSLGSSKLITAVDLFFYL